MSGGERSVVAVTVLLGLRVVELISFKLSSQGMGTSHCERREIYGCVSLAK
jgi:hypothetical protein